jgi:serine/threonine-protein kinase
MANASSCPDVGELERFLVGQVTEADADRVEQHLGQCGACLKTMHALTGEDTLVQAMRRPASAVTQELPGDVLDDLVVRFRSMQLPGTDPAQRSQDRSNERDDFLAAPEGPGEIGRLGSYRVLKVLGAGGMGVVYQARQARPQRLVALKMILAGARGGERLARFRSETEVVARLQHPNIVQVYEVGEHDGRPYFAMEFLGGGSLGQKLAAAPLTVRAAAELAAALARAVQHAHERGVVHRDLKPANVLLTADGTPKIVDFGLAKLLEGDPGTPPAEYQTESGAILGTPGYMAPEQALGRGKEIGPAADGYALGAILYEALTGRPPFKGATVLETLEQVRSQDPVAPSRLRPGLPRDLQTICLKCLEKEPGRRYASAQELADDLGRFLGGEPIRARPVPLWERAVKWARRRPAAAGLMALSGLAIGGLIGGLWLYTTSLDAQVQRTEKQKQRADTNYGQARATIKQMLDRLDEFRAPGVRQIESLRRGLRQDALKFFEGITAQADPDPATRPDVAEAYVTMGRLLLVQGQPESVRVKLDHARLLLEELIAEDPADRKNHAELGNCLDTLGHTAGGQGRFEECIRFHEQALAVRQELCRAEPDNVAWQRAVAVSLNNLGYWYYETRSSDTRRLQQAEHYWQEAVTTREKLFREHPKEALYQHDLAVSCSNLALLYVDTGRTREAEPLYRKSETLLTEMVREHPEVKRWTEGLVHTLRNWGGHLLCAGREEEAWPRLTRAVEIMDKWVHEDPQDPWGQDFLLDCLVAHMNNCTALHKQEDGEKDWQRALQLSARRKSWDELCTGAFRDARFFGAHTLATARAEHLLNQPGISDANRFELAKAYAQAIQAAGKDSQISLAEQGLKAERYAAEAVRLLETMRATGFFREPAQVEKLRTDSDLEPLRPREDYRKVLAQATSGG